MGDVLVRHPRMVKRWAKIYVKRYRENKDEAVKWAMNFFDKADIAAMVPEVKRLMGSKAPPQ